VSNYLVDASVYALPKQIQDKTDAETINLYEEYLENLNKLFEFIDLTSDDRNLKINHFLFCAKDIKLMIDNNLFLDDDILTKLRRINLQKKHKFRLENLGNFILNEISPLRWKGKNIKPEKICSIENYIGVDNISIKKDIFCVPDIAGGISNVNLADNLKKNIGILAFLNEKVYKSQDITKIITSNHEKECSVNISILDITHNFNNLERQNINISDCTILNNDVRNLKKCEFSSIDDALENARNNFKDTLEYSKNIYESIEEYEKILTKLRNDNNDIEKINKHKKEYPVIVYDCLYTLDKLVKYYKQNDKKHSPQPLSRNFNCNSIGDNNICNKCRGYLRVCGYDCSDERKEDLNNEKVKEARTIDDQLFQIHLKPYSKTEGAKYSEKSLRIYFRWDTDKIKIGYIGKHLYLPPKTINSLQPQPLYKLGDKK
jgi:hypothetical protein